MKRKTASGIMTSLLLFGMLTLTFNIQPVRAEPLTIIIPDDYPTIQEAINNANDGDTIYVRAETYYENVVVNKTVSLVGENRNNTIIDGSYGIPTGGSVIKISADNVEITGFRIQNDSNGIMIRSSNNTIIGNFITNIGCLEPGWSAVEVEGQFNVISHNTISNSCTLFAIDGSGFISNNVITNTGIIWVGGDSVVTNNIISNPSGIHAFGSNIHISNNILTGATIALEGSYDSTITNNTIIDSEAGIVLGGFSKYNVIKGNTVMNSLKGILLAPYEFVGYPAIYPWPPPGWIPEPTYNNVTENIIINNEIGLYIENSYKNIIYHNNFVNNTHQVSTEVWNYWPPDYWPPWEYVWDNGYPSGGNYWSDYEGVDFYSGPNQNQNGSDGIGDESHFVGKVPEDTKWLWEHIDYYPLVNPWEPPTSATLDIRPNTLNLRSRSRLIKGFIELLEGYDVSSINVNSIMLNSTVPVDEAKIGGNRLMVTFDKAKVKSLIIGDMEFPSKSIVITLTIMGRLYDGTLFEGTDTIRVMR